MISIHDAQSTLIGDILHNVVGYLSPLIWERFPLDSIPFLFIFLIRFEKLILALLLNTLLSLYQYWTLGILMIKLIKYSSTKIVSPLTMVHNLWL